MRIVIFGASGMIGGAALREALLNPQIERIQAVVRNKLNQTHPKLEQIQVSSLSDPALLQAVHSETQACYFCVGISSAGMTEEAYTELTYDLTVDVARLMLQLNSKMKFIYVSAEGADQTEKGPVMWARVRGRLENQLLREPFKEVYIVRPALVRPMHGIQSQTKLYKYSYQLLQPLLVVLRSFRPFQIATTETIGRAMVGLGLVGYEKQILLTRDFEVLFRKLQKRSEPSF